MSEVEVKTEPEDEASEPSQGQGQSSDQSDKPLTESSHLENKESKSDVKDERQETENKEQLNGVKEEETDSDNVNKSGVEEEKPIEVDDGVTQQESAEQGELNDYSENNSVCKHFYVTSFLPCLL